MATPPKKPAAKKPRTPKRPSHLAKGRWLGDFPRLSAAEKRLVECCARGEDWVPIGWDSQRPIRPKKKSATNIIRAELIRFLALGGDDQHPVHEEGVMVGGAWITGTLDLHQSQAVLRLDLHYCHFESVPNLMAIQLPELALVGSLLPGLYADRMKVAGGVFLRDGFVASGEVRLPGAEIGDDLDCNNGSFTNKNEHALNVNAVKVSGGFILHEATIDGAILLSSATINTLFDGDFNWYSGGHFLDGLRYDQIIGPTDAARRIAWLKSQRSDHLDGDGWKPQPWEQLIKVLREMGHPGAAAEVAMEKQRMMRAAGQIGTREPNARYKWAWRRKLDAGWTRISNVLTRQFHDFYGWIAGYGYRPTRIVGKMALLWLVCGGLYWAAADRYGAIGPADPAITSPTLYPDAAELCGHGNEPGKTRWTECPGVPDEYSTFQPFVYSLDLILPLIDLQQESDWAPIAEGPTGQDLLPGVIVRWVMWLEILFGWFASLMFVAIVSRLVEKD